MDKYKMLEKLRNNLNNTSFDYFVKVVKKFGFKKIKRKTSGSHIHKFINNNINERLNIQPDNAKSKPYQLKQFIEVVKKYDL